MKLNKITKATKEMKLPKTMIYTGSSDLETSIYHYRYSKNSFNRLDDIDNPSSNQSDMIVVEGFNNKEEVLKLTSKFGVNEFFVEDIFNVTQRNKIEVNHDQTFLVLKYAFFENGNLDFRRIYFVLKKGLVLIFSDYKNRYVNILLDRVNTNNAMFTSYDESYVIYTIYDMIVDEYLELIRVLKLQLEDLESDIMKPDKTMSQDLFNIHKQLVQLRNNVRSFSDNTPPKELIKSDLFNKELIPFISDLEDHIFNLSEKLNTNIEVCNSLVTMYSTQISNKTNEVMKTLTIISVIFIPLSFIAGVFGMNFVKFDILKNENGLLIFGLISLFVVFGMLAWFKLRKWL